MTKGEVVTTASQVGWSSMPSYSDANFETMVQYGWRRNELIYACINKTANTASQIALQVVDQDGDPIDNHPLKALIQRPNPYMSEFDFWSSIVLYQKLGGRAIYEKVRSRSGQVVQLYPLRPDWIAVKASGSVVDYYVYQPPGIDKVILQPSDVVDFVLYDPLNSFNGWAPVAVAARVGDADNAATDHIKLTWEKGGVPAGLLKTTQKLVPAQVEAIRALWRDRYGGHDKWLEPIVLDSDAEYQKIGFSFNELGFDVLDSRSEARICMVLDVPPILVGAKVGLDRATYSNYAEARRSWWEDSLIPLYRNFEDVIINQLAPEFGNPLIEWDFSNVPALQEERNSRWTRATAALQAGGITVNEFCEEVGLEEKGEPGDVYLRGFSIVEVPVTGREEEEMPEPVEPEEETEEEEPEEEETEKTLRIGGKQNKAELPPDDNLRRKHERTFQQEMEAFFAGQLGRIEKALKQKALADVDQLFWDEEDKALFRLLKRLLLAGALAGAETAMRYLVEGAGIGIDWALVNEAALNWARKHGGAVAHGINETTRKAVQNELVDWIQSGQPLDELIDSLAPTFGEIRAEMVAVTEVTQAFAEGNMISWRESGVVSGKRWMTANDELVCPICAPLDGMVVGLDENGFTTEAGGIGLTAPPAHPRCRCWLQPAGV